MRYDDGCAYCLEMWKIRTRELYVSIQADKLLVENMLDGGDEDTKIQISFCPFCGTKLKGENE